MQSCRIAILATAFLATTPLTSAVHAGVHQPVRYLQLVNRAPDSLVSLSVADTGTQDFRVLPLVTPLRGGGDSTTIEVAGGNCLRDFRFTFRDGRSLIYKQVDACRTQVLRILQSGRAPTR